MAAITKKKSEIESTRIIKKCYFTQEMKKNYRQSMDAADFGMFILSVPISK